MSVSVHASARKTRAAKPVASVLALACTLGMSFDAWAQNCKPRSPRPPVVISDMGPCEFIPELASFSGDPIDQAMCLMRSADVKLNRNLGAPLDGLPLAIISRVGQTTGLPERTALASHLIELGLMWDYAPFLWQPISRARDNDPAAPQARYFVIHDTSAPFLGGRPFPIDIDTNESINNLARYDCRDDWAFAHVVINRSGGMLRSRELGQPWRATKLERAAGFGADLKGLFLHIELIQPRGSAPGRGHRNDARAPTPGFSAAQYERLALIYVIASVRADRWLIPAFHAAIDSGIRGGHDDPQNFEIEAFASAIERLVARLNGDETPEMPPLPKLAVAVPAPAIAAAPTLAVSDEPVVHTAAIASEAAPVEAPPAVASAATAAVPAPETATAAPVQAPAAAVTAPALEASAPEEPIAVAAVTAESPIPAAHTTPAEAVPLPVPRAGPPAGTTSASDGHAQQKKIWHKLNWQQKNAWWKQHNARAKAR